MGSEKAKEAMEKLRGGMKGMPSGGGGGSSRILLAAKVLGAAGLTGWALYNSVFNVDGGHRAVMYSRISGIKENIYEEGTHFMIPWIERPIIYDVRTRPRTVQSLTGSNDLQMVNINLRVLSRPVQPKLPQIYRELGIEYDEVVLPSIVNEVLKEVVAQFNAAQLLTQREQVSKLIRRNLVERSISFNINVEDVSIIDLSFGREFTAAVEAKQVAQQDAERSKFIVEKALQEKRSTIIRAQGEAKSAELIGKAIANNAAFIELKRLDAAKEISHVISQSGNRLFLSADSLLLNLMGDSGTQSRLTVTDATAPAAAAAKGWMG